MNTKILEYILAIAEEGSISRAAERFYLSQPALSIHLKKAEQRIGVPLFTREKGKMTLTPAGILYVNNAQLILHLEKQLKEELGSLQQKQKHVLNVTIEPSFYNAFLMEILPDFQRNNPDFHVEVNSGSSIQAITALRDKFLDFAICITTSPQVSGLESILLDEDDLVVIFPSDYRGPTSIGKLSTAIDSGLFPLMHPIGTSMRIITEECLAEAGIIPTTILENANFHDAINLIREWPCFSFIPGSLLPAAQKSGAICSPPQKHIYTLFLYRPDMPVNQLIKELLQTGTDGFGHFIGRRAAGR